MIYEQDITIENDDFRLDFDSRFITAGSYLKGLHWCDVPTELMPRDAVLLKAARRFYAKLTEEDQLVIDSFSDEGLYASMDKSKRDKRFNYLCKCFMCEMGTESRYTTLLLPYMAEKGKQNESD